jgi:CheY-like chemotaxis protein
MSSLVADVGTVMVVDDSDDIRELLRVGLQRRGCRVVEAVNGREAVELAARVRPDLILMDLSMPVMDGFEATRRLKAHPDLTQIPVVAVSAFCDPPNRRMAVKAGCDDCVGKPVNLSLLDSLVEKYLRSV